MHLKNKLFTIKSVLNQNLFKKRVPLSVSWTLTNRCNKKCDYCNLPNITSKELKTKQIISIIEDLSKLGTQRIGFTGGEPLLRKDIKEIIDFSHDEGIFTGMISNGSLVNKYIQKIKNLDLLQLSLDGPQWINDRQRYQGSYKDVINALKVAINKIPNIWLTSVLTKNNLNSIHFILDLAEQYNSKVFFQPVVNYDNCGVHANNLVPVETEYKQTIKKLIKIKKINKHIGNSRVGLDYLYHWPIPQKLKCYSGKLFSHIYPNGDIYPCFNMDGKKHLNCLRNGFEKAFTSLKIKDCSGCFTYANIEMNYLFNFNLNAGLNCLKLMD
ncbi:MAG: radical SAM protein [Nanoarchaeota archaeon]